MVFIMPYNPSLSPSWNNTCFWQRCSIENSQCIKHAINFCVNSFVVQPSILLNTYCTALNKNSCVEYLVESCERSRTYVNISQFIMYFITIYRVCKKKTPFLVTNKQIPSRLSKIFRCF